MPFGITSAAIGGVGSIVGGGKQANATKQAAQLQATSAANATQLQRDEFNTAQANEQPFMQGGVGALNTLTGQLPSLTAGFDPTSQGIPSQFNYTQADFNKDPAFQTVMDRGTQAIQRSAAASGGALGGATAKALNDYAMGTANQFYQTDKNSAQSVYQQNYGNAFNTFTSNQNNAFNKLSSLTGVGLNAATGSNAAGTNFANNSSNIALQAGNSAAAGTIGVANSQANMWGGLSSAAQGVVNNPSFQQLMSSYGNKPSAAATNVNNASEFDYE